MASSVQNFRVFCSARKNTGAKLLVLRIVELVLQKESQGRHLRLRLAELIPYSKMDRATTCYSAL
jgi:hypothetical protein